MSVSRWTALVLSAGVAAGCGEAPEGVGAELRMTSVSSVVERLEDAGVAVEVVGPVESFYPADATQLHVDGEEMTVFEFPSEADAQASSSSRPLVQWLAPPHFYHAARFMALYVGSTGRVLGALEEVFGEELDP